MIPGILIIRRVLIATALLVPLLVLGTAAPRAEAADGEKTECRCDARRACWHYLNAPVNPPDDSCVCTECETRGRHDGSRPISGWNPRCWTSNRMDCFLQRHAASWKLACSACLEADECCPYDGSASCPDCAGPGKQRPIAKDPFRKEIRQAIDERMAVERRFFNKKAPVIVYSRRFYVVTDVDRMRLRMESGTFRWATGHEWAHIMVQRAEKAHAEFVEAFGSGVRLTRPMGIFLPKNENTARRLQEVYFRARRNHMIYSAYTSASESAISEGFCLNGFCVPVERMKGNASASRNRGGEDYAMHQAMRHLIGHILVTCWVRTDGDNRTIPRWMFVGAGHWLGKRPEQLRDNVYYCAGEAQRLSGSGQEWWKRLTERAELGKFEPIEELMGRTSLGQLDWEDHQRCWGYFQVCLEQWRKPFVAMMKDLRLEKGQRESFLEHLGITPEQFQERWEERILGKRETVAPRGGGMVAAGEPPPRPKLDPTLDPPALAARIRALGEIDDPALVGKLFDLIGGTKSDRVREAAAMALHKTKGDALNAIPDVGLTHPKRMARAYAARTCRKLAITTARFPLRKALEDPFWLARAEAAVASGRIKDYDAQARMRDMLADGSPKARIGAMDGLTLFGEDRNPICVPLIAKNLTHPKWQVRLAACQTLAQIGDHQAVEPLIERLKIEGGRVREALRKALLAISGEDFGDSPDRWRKWWDLERENVKERGGFTTGVRPKKDPEKPSRYGPDEPRYYGIEIYSLRVAYVLDTSRSTHRNFHPDSRTAKRLLGVYGDRTTTVNGICRREIEESVERLHPAARFNLIAFGTDVRVWKPQLIPASPSNKRSAGSFVRSRSPVGETNFHGALSAALGLDDREAGSPAFGDAPDTIQFLTDGTPTVGDVVDPDTLLAWYTDLNRYSRVRTNTIAFGALGVDEKLLRNLATRNWGDFVQLFESNPK